MAASTRYVNRDWKRMAFAITPHDTNELAYVVSEIYVGGTGDLKVLFMNDTTAVTFKAVPVGTVIKGKIKRVDSTGTTATLLVGVV